MTEKNILQIDPILQQLNTFTNDNEHPGAILCGVEGLIIKCHGYASAQGMFNAIQGAYYHVQKNLVSHLKTFLVKKTMSE
jgi:glycerol-3-phosphate acyltransferase PlsX